MSKQHVLRASALVLGLGISQVAFADQDRPQQQQQDRGRDQQSSEQQGKGDACPACEKGIGAQSKGESQWSPSLSQDQSAQGRGSMGVGVGGQQGKEGASAVPQYWIADASLFIGNAANTAHTLALEQGLNVPSPMVVGNHAQFLVTAVNRALTSLTELQQNAEASNPAAAAEIRTAIGNLVAAQAQAQQIADATNAGTFGQTFEPALRATYSHLTAAERSMASVGRAYGTAALAAASTCPTRAFGAGLGPQRSQQQKKGGQDQQKVQEHKGQDPQKGQDQPKGGPEQNQPAPTP